MPLGEIEVGKTRWDHWYHMSMQNLKPCTIQVNGFVLHATGPRWKKWNWISHRDFLHMWKNAISAVQWWWHFAPSRQVPSKYGLMRSSRDVPVPRFKDPGKELSWIAPLSSGKKGKKWRILVGSSLMWRGGRHMHRTHGTGRIGSNCFTGQSPGTRGTRSANPVPRYAALENGRVDWKEEGLRGFPPRIGSSWVYWIQRCKDLLWLRREGWLLSCRRAKAFRQSTPLSDPQGQQSSTFSAKPKKHWSGRWGPGTWWPCTRLWPQQSKHWAFFAEHLTGFEDAIQSTHLPKHSWMPHQ